MPLRHGHQWATQTTCDAYVTNTLCGFFRQESMRIRERAIHDLHFRLDALLEEERKLGIDPTDEGGLSNGTR